MCGINNLQIVLSSVNAKLKANWQEISSRDKQEESKPGVQPFLKVFSTLRNIYRGTFSAIIYNLAYILVETYFLLS